MPEATEQLVTDEAPAFVVIPDVEIVSTGTYDLSSGTVTFTEDDLAQAVAAYEDPGVQAPRLKIGHTDPRFDGEPAFGKVENLRLSPDRQTVIGDYVGVPKWLADILPTAYPSRSIEGFQGATTATGKKYGLVITAVALLGTTLPGVATLEDLRQLYQAGVEQNLGSGIAAAAHAISGEVIHASVNVEDVRRAYYDSLSAEQMFWWVRAVLLDPPELIVDDDEGGLYRVPFDAAKMNFSDPVPVRIEYVDADGVKASRTSATFASRDVSRPAPTNPTEEVDEMDPVEVRQRLGLAEDASDEDVLAQIDALRSEDTGAPAAAGDSDDAPQSDDDAPQSDDVPEVPEGLTVIDTATLESLREAADLGVAARRQQVEEARERLLASAVSEGRIPPARVEHYRRLHDADPKGTEQLLASLEPGVVPVQERGSSKVEASAQDDAYPPHWLPEVNHRQAQEA